MYAHLDCLPGMLIWFVATGVSQFGSLFFLGARVSMVMFEIVADIQLGHGGCTHTWYSKALGQISDVARCEVHLFHLHHVKLVFWPDAKEGRDRM